MFSHSRAGGLRNVSRQREILEWPYRNFVVKPKKTLSLLNAKELTLHVSDDELAARRDAWRPPESTAVKRGYLSDFSATVAQANDGCVSRAFIG